MLRADGLDRGAICETARYVLLRSPPHIRLSIVFPAKAGIQGSAGLIPAFAGITDPVSSHATSRWAGS